MIGSVMYMPPEVARRERYSEKADAFSFALLMHELTAGQLLSTCHGVTDRAGAAAHLRKVS